MFRLQLSRGASWWWALAQAVILFGTTWSAAVFTQVLTGQDNVEVPRWVSVVVLMPASIAYICGVFLAPTPAARALQSVFTVVALLVLLISGVTALVGPVVLSPEGFRKRVAAAVSVVLLVLELRRQLRERRALAADAPPAE